MVKQALLSLSDDSPRTTGEGPVNNQVTITLKPVDQRGKYCTFQVNRRDMLKLVADYADESFFTHIPAKLKA
jgi:hypothetical protein